MPIGKFSNTQACISAQMSKMNPKTGQKFTKEEAGKICSAMEKNMMSVFSEISFGEGLNDSELQNKEFEILSAGKKIYRGGTLTITENDLSEMEKNFNENVVGTQLAVDINHDEDHRAVAWFNSVRKVGNKLLATFKDFTEEGKRLILEKQYKYFSVEFENGFEKLTDGVKRIFNNVLRGVALTNRPVDKAIAPAFMSEKLYSFFNLNTMNQTLKKLSEHLLAKDKLTKDEKALWKESVNAFSEEEQAAEGVAEATAEVEAKPDAEVVDDEAAKKAEEEKKAAEEAAAKAEAEKAELAEKNKSTETKLSELQSELSKLKEENRKKELAETCKRQIQLSEKRNIGLNKKDTTEFSEFLATLSNKQVEQVFSFMERIKHVDFSEIGSGSAGKVKGRETEELTKLAEARAEKDSVTLGEAMKRVLSERPDLAENL